jgi:hypothetical protein
MPTISIFFSQLKRVCQLKPRSDQKVLAKIAVKKQHLQRIVIRRLARLNEIVNDQLPA